MNLRKPIVQVRAPIMATTTDLVVVVTRTRLKVCPRQEHLDGTCSHRIDTGRDKRRKVKKRITQRPPKLWWLNDNERGIVAVGLVLVLQASLIMMKEATQPRGGICRISGVSSYHNVQFCFGYQQWFVRSCTYVYLSLLDDDLDGKLYATISTDQRHGTTPPSGTSSRTATTDVSTDIKANLSLFSTRYACWCALRNID